MYFHLNSMFWDSTLYTVSFDSRLFLIKILLNFQIPRVHIFDNLAERMLRRLASVLMLPRLASILILLGHVLGVGMYIFALPEEGNFLHSGSFHADLRFIFKTHI